MLSPPKIGNIRVRQQTIFGNKNPELMRQGFLIVANQPPEVVLSHLRGAQSSAWNADETTSRFPRGRVVRFREVVSSALLADQVDLELPLSCRRLGEAFRQEPLQSIQGPIR